MHAVRQGAGLHRIRLRNYLCAQLLILWGLAVCFGGVDLPVEQPRPRPPGVPLPVDHAAPRDLPVVRPDPSDAPPPVFFGEDILSERGEIIFILDQSASMWEGTPNATRAGQTKWSEARAELTRALEGMSSSLKFNLVAYDCNTYSLWAAPREASAANVAQAKAWVDALWPSGGTGTAPACIVGLDQVGPGAKLVLLMDGQGNCPMPDVASHRDSIRRANTDGIPIDVFGLFVQPNGRSFARGIAADSGGAYFEVR